VVIFTRKMFGDVQEHRNASAKYSGLVVRVLTSLGESKSRPLFQDVDGLDMIASDQVLHMCHSAT
jgi:hypothetical protein